MIAVLGPVASWSDGPRARRGTGGVHRGGHRGLDGVRAARLRRAAELSVGDVWVYGVDLLLAPLGLRDRDRGRRAALGARDRVPPARAAPAGVRAGAPIADRPGARALPGLPRHRDAARRRRRDRRRLHRLAQPRRRRARDSRSGAGWVSARSLRDLEFGALLHDVGKIAVPNAIINKPGKLDGRGVGDHEEPHDRRSADARERRRRAGAGRRDRPGLARGLSTAPAIRTDWSATRSRSRRASAPPVTPSAR